MSGIDVDDGTGLVATYLLYMVLNTATITAVDFSDSIDYKTSARKQY
jgi:ubiquinone/menaquinone biosynthesis C-methylase UbiE